MLRRLGSYAAPLFILLGAMDLVLRWTLPPEKLLPYMQKEVAYYTVKVDRFMSRPAPDVLVLGSSRIRDALIPDIFVRRLSGQWGRTAPVYNLGLGGAHSEEYYTLVSSYLPDPPPPYVVIGFSGTEVACVHIFTFASRFLWHLENFLSYLGRTSHSNFQVKHCEYYIESLLCRIWYLFEQRDALSRLAGDSLASALGLKNKRESLRKEEEKQRRLAAHILADDGYLPFLPERMNLQEALRTNPGSVQPRSWDLVRNPALLDEASAELLGLILERLRNRGSRVALVESPPSPYLQRRNPVLHGTGFRKWMHGVAADLDVLFIPAPPADTRLYNSLYRDPNHMTEEGAKRYTRYIFSKLRDAGFFEEDGR
jgi:hypothetical protein